MIRWVVLFLLGFGAVLAVLGEDHGQRRAGLAGAPVEVQVEAQVGAQVGAVPAKPAADKPAADKPAADKPEAPVVAAAPKPVPPAKPAKPALLPAPTVGKPLVTAAIPGQAPGTDVAPAGGVRVSGAGMGTDTETVAPSPAGGPGRLVALQGVNLRAGPGRNYGVMASLLAGDVVELLADDDPIGGWRHVKLPDGRRGYVGRDLVAPAP